MSAAKSFHEMMADKMSGGTADAGSDDASEAPDYGEGLKDAAQGLLDAIHGKDVDGVAEALKSAFALCGKGKDDAGAPGDDAPSHALLLVPHGKH